MNPLHISPPSRHDVVNGFKRWAFFNLTAHFKAVQYRPQVISPQIMNAEKKNWLDKGKEVHCCRKKTTDRHVYCISAVTIVICFIVIIIGILLAALIKTRMNENKSKWYGKHNQYNYNLQHKIHAHRYCRSNTNYCVVFELASVLGKLQFWQIGQWILYSLCNKMLNSITYIERVFLLSYINAIISRYVFYIVHVYWQGNYSYKK